MRWRAFFVVFAAAAAPVLWLRSHAPEPCDAGFDATFVQIRDDQASFDASQWRHELDLLGQLGVRIIILQFAGDREHAYDVAPLLEAAAALDIGVFVGLYKPSDVDVERFAPPLDDPDQARELGALCTRSPACRGWYISQEIDDATWSERTDLLRAHLARTSRALRALAPGKAIAIAPFFTGKLEPAEFARWWTSLLEPETLDIFILQDGVGTGRATPERAASYLVALRPALAGLGVDLWSVAELFHQRHGLPIDNEPFDGVPMNPAELRHSLAIESPLVTRVVAFSVLDYMDPKRGAGARRLHDDYAARCRATSSSWRTPCG